jgi:hypothetical protein
MLELVEEINKLIKSVSQTAYQRMLLPEPAENHGGHHEVKQTTNRGNTHVYRGSTEGYPLPSIL